MENRSEGKVVRTGSGDLVQVVTRAEDQQPRQCLLRRARGQVNTIGSCSDGNIGTRVDQDFCPVMFTHFSVTCFDNGQRKLEKLTRREILFPNLNEVDAQLHLVPYDVEQRAKPSCCLAIGNVVALQTSVPSIN